MALLAKLIESPDAQCRQDQNGIVIDHIKAGQGIRIFNWLGLGKGPYNVAFVVNAVSEHLGRKDIIKIDNEISIDFAVLGLIDRTSR
jgi:aspartate carbamoyltransferase regulatory subunit